jgi:hypothetical protein
MQARDQLRETLGQVTFAKLLEEETCCILQAGILPVVDERTANGA